MFRFLLSIFFTATLCSLVYAQKTDNNNTVRYERELTYGSPNDPTLPLWVRKMYEADPNLYEVETLYKEYYKSHKFEKNAHTQYFKRWKKYAAPFVNKDGFVRPPSKTDYDKLNDEFLTRKLEAAIANSQKSISGWGTANWTCIGPFDFDKDAGGRSHAPGAAHVYTLEKAPSNPDILYCGTAEAGVWKTTDRGLNWACLTKNIPFTYCNAVEIHPTDPNTVWIGANSRVYKSTDGGSSWTTAGDAAFNALSHSIDDMALQPGNPNILFVASDRGLYRSTDGGGTFSRVIDVQSSDAYFSEIEFKPDDANTVYVVQSSVSNLYSEFYKSTDGGLTFNNTSGWPVIASANSQTLNYINRLSADNSYASFTNDNLGTATTPDFTLEMRIRVPSSISDKAILSNKNWSSGSNNGWVLAARYTGQLMFNVGTGSSRIELLSSGIWDNTWHHVAVVWRASGTKEMYKDGVLVATSSTAMTITNTGLPMILGRDGNLAYGGYDIDIDDVRIWNTPLAAADIAAWRNTDLNNTHPSYANLLHYYKCNEPSGTMLTDEQGTNHGTINGTMARKVAQIHSSTTLLTGSDNQKRAEISVTAAKPNRVYALLSGAANGGSGLYGVYVSDDAGATWSHKCCGIGPGGVAVAAPGGVTTPSTNANMLGYSETGSDEGGQYYYDLAMDADPNNGDKVHIGGINHWYSTDGGNTFTLTAKWSWPGDAKYVHADIHGIHIYGNEVWINCDGGIFMSQDSGKLSFNKRQYGIAGTDFWGFGMGHKDGDVMLGGTYHNSHLLKNDNVYLGGWTSYTGSADGTRGFVNPGKPKEVYNDSRRDLLPSLRTQSPTALTLSKLPNTDPTSKITWDPRCYNCIYTGTGADLWYSEDDGVNWVLIKNFGTMNVADIEIGWDDPNILWVTTAGGFYSPKEIWRSNDRGATWNNVTPSSATLGFPSDMWLDISLGMSSQDVWLATTHRYGWNSSNAHKIFYSANGGSTWTDWTTAIIANESVNDMFYQRGTNGGIYLGTRNSVFYRNKSMSDWIQYDNGLPAKISCTRIMPWYKEGKIRNASNRSVWESNMYELGTPQAQPMSDKLTSGCQRDTFYLADYSAHYKTGATFNWNITPPPAFISSSTVDNPKVVFGAPGTYSVSLTVTDSLGSSTKGIIGDILINAGCAADTLPDKALSITTNGQYAEANSALNITTNTITLMAWVKPSVTHTGVAGVIFARGSTNTSGIHLDNNNELRYHWGNTSYWSYSSGQYLPTNEWSHVALVISPTEAKLYLNGKAATKTATHSAATFDVPFRIGNDPNSSSRTFKGLIDEVAIYNRSLSQNEIREQMHLTKKPEEDATLLSYYQFNESTTAAEILDRSAIRHARFINGSTRAVSSAPVGGGASNSSRLSIAAGGSYAFGNTGLTLEFPNSGTIPNGELVATRISHLPDASPDANIAPSSFWTINNYGTNNTFSALPSFTLAGVGSVSAGNELQLFKRKTGEDGATWGSNVGTLTAAATSGNATISFTNPNITSFSQFVFSKTNASPLPVSWLNFYLKTDEKAKVITLFWSTASEQNSDYFIIERSSDAIHFEPIGRVAANGNSVSILNYAFSDENPFIGKTIYYRIKQVDFDGKFSYSSIKSALINNLLESFQISPNPVKSGENITIKSLLEDCTVSTTDANGRVLFSRALNKGSNTIDSSSLSAGVYYFQFDNGTDKVMKKIIVFE